MEPEGEHVLQVGVGLGKGVATGSFWVSDYDRKTWWGAVKATS